MKHLLSVDPGTNCLGWARWREGVLVACGFISTDAKQQRSQKFSDIRYRIAVTPAFHPEKHRWEERRDLHEAVHAICEYPIKYEKDKVDPNDLIAVAAVAGMAVAYANTMQYVLPGDWKGQTPKPKKKSDGPYIIAERVKRTLSREELSLVDPDSPFDVWDALGIGLWKLGRKYKGESLL